MTWWMIVLMVAGYAFVAFCVVGATSDGTDDFQAYLIGAFWPLSLVALIVMGFVFAAYKFGKFIGGKLEDFLNGIF